MDIYVGSGGPCLEPHHYPAPPSQMTNTELLKNASGSNLYFARNYSIYQEQDPTKQMRFVSVSLAWTLLSKCERNDVLSATNAAKLIHSCHKTAIFQVYQTAFD